MTKLDLSKITAELESRKEQKDSISALLGENVQKKVKNRDEFLHGLLQASNTGRSNESSEKIKLIENSAAIKSGEKPKFNVNKEFTPEPIPQQRRTIVEDTGGKDRDELLFAELEKRKKQTLAGSIEQFTGVQNPQYNQPRMNLNENVDSGNVEKTINNYLINNLPIILEESIKSVILEMYATDRIKEVLKTKDGSDIVRTHVINVIKELQNKKK